MDLSEQGDFCNCMGCTPMRTGHGLPYFMRNRNHQKRTLIISCHHTTILTCLYTHILKFPPTLRNSSYSCVCFSLSHLQKSLLFQLFKVLHFCLFFPTSSLLDHSYQHLNILLFLLYIFKKPSLNLITQSSYHIIYLPIFKAKLRERMVYSYCVQCLSFHSPLNLLQLGMTFDAT